MSESKKDKAVEIIVSVIVCALVIYAICCFGYFIDHLPEFKDAVVKEAASIKVQYQNEVQELQNDPND
jgi:hypothetical protein